MQITRGALILIICVAIGSALGIWGIRGLIEHEVQAKVQTALVKADYKKDIKDYKDCATRQSNTYQGNIRAAIQKKFLIIAAAAREEAAQQFKLQDNLPEAAVNFTAAKQEQDLATKVKTTQYITCVKPPTPKGITAVALPSAPYNYKAK